MSKVIPFSQLARAQHLNYLEHKRREYLEREDYLARLRRLLFQIEGQMRQAEVLQQDLYLQVARHFHLDLVFPSPGDRLALQIFFVENPLLRTLTDFFQGKISAEECLARIQALGEAGKASGDERGKPPAP